MFIALTSKLHDSCEQARADLAALDDEGRTIISCTTLLRSFTAAVRRPGLPHGEVFEMADHMAEHIADLYETMVDLSDTSTLEAIAPARAVVKAIDSTRRPV